MTNVRNWLVEQVKPLTPSKWRWIPYDVELDSIDRPTAMLKLQSINRTPSAPGSGHTVSFVLTIIEPKTNPGPLDDALDDELLDLIHALDRVPNVTWSNAQRVLFADTNIAYDVTLEVLSTP